MKVLLLLLSIIGLALAAPTAQKLGFKNLYSKVPNTVRPNPRIINGQEAVPHSIPYQAFVQVTGHDGGWFCGGSLISPKAVVTAGHCGDGAFIIDVILGAHHAFHNEDTQIIITTFDYVIHPNFDPIDLRNDVAVVIFPRGVPLNEYIQTVPLAQDPSILYEGETGIVSGWGSTDGSSTSMSAVLNVANSTIMNNAECATYFEEVQDDNICLSGENSISGCYGDSGGPLTVNGVQVGIVSFGHSGCTLGYPSVFTRVTSVIEFINSIKQQI